MQERQPLRLRHRQGGFGLIEILVVLVIICILAAVMIPKIAGRSGSADKTKHTPIERAHDTAGLSYDSQIKQAIMMYRDDNDGKNPPDLQSLKKYGVVDEMLVDQVTRKPLAYNPQTGSVGDAARAELGITSAAPGTAPTATDASQRKSVGPGGVTLPNIPQPSAGAGDDN